jgi:hypothetical protein
MTDEARIQNYINNFRRHLARYLKPNVGLSCTVHPATEGGAILVFTIGTGMAAGDRFLEHCSRVNDALEGIPQRAFGGNLAGFSFAGTNIIAEDGRIILIKGDDEADTWSDAAASSDVDRLLPPPMGGRR